MERSALSGRRSLVFLGLFMALVPAVVGAQELKVAENAQGVTSFEMLSRFFGAVREGLLRFQNNDWAAQTGQRIALALTLLIFIWGVIKSWILGKGFSQLLGDFLQPVIMLGLVFAAINANLGRIINDSVLAISAGFQFGQVQTPEQLMGRLAEIAFSVFELTPQDAPALYDLPGWFFLSIGFLIKLIAAMIIIASAALAGGIYLLTEVSVALAIALGPLLYSWGIWKPTEFLFTGWLKFLVVAAFQKLVVVMVVSITGGVIQSVATNLAPDLRNSTADFQAYAGILMIALLNAMLIVKAPSIAAGLISGSGSIDLSRWNIGGQAASTGAKAPAAVKEKAVKAKDSLANKVADVTNGAKATVAGVKAFREAKGGMNSMRAGFGAARESWSGGNKKSANSSSAGSGAQPQGQGQPSNLKFPPISPPSP